MIDLEQLKKCNDHDWHKPYGGQITLNCEDVDILLKAFDKACELLATYDEMINSECALGSRQKIDFQNSIMKEVSK